MEVAAAKATLLPKLGKPRMKLNVHASQTEKKVNELSIPIHLLRLWEGEPVRMGDFHRLLTWPKNLCPGMPPSRANAYIILEFEVIEKVLRFKPVSMSTEAGRERDLRTRRST